MTESITIKSRDNERLKHVRRIRDGNAEGLIFIEGVRLAEEAMRSNIVVEAYFLSETFGGSDRKTSLVDQINLCGHSYTVVADNIFSSISDTQNPQGIVLIARRPENSKRSIESNLLTAPLAIFLHEIGDPSNLGGIIRTAEAAGVAGIIISNGSASAFSPKSLRAAMGSAFRLPIWESAKLDEVLIWAKNHRLRTMAADINAETEYHEIDWKVPSLVVFGSEGHGLSAEIIGMLDELTRIPMANNVESLNLAVSCGILLFEAKRQHMQYSPDHGIG